MTSARTPPASRTADLGELRALLATAWCVPGANAADTASLRGDQWRAAVNQFPTSTLGLIALFGLAWLALGSRADAGTLLVLALPVACVNVFNLVLWWRERSRPAATPRSGLAVAMLGADLVLTGLVDSALALYCVDAADDSLRLAMVAGAAGMIAAATWMFALLPAAALGWLVGVLSGLALGIVLWPVDPLRTVLPLLPLYGAALAAPVLLNARLFLRGRQAQREAGRQGEWVSLLLRDFEAHASDWLWEIDAKGDLRHVSQRLAERLGLSVDVLRGQSLLKLLAARQPASEPDAAEHLEALARALRESNSFRELDLAVQIGAQRVWWSLSGRRLEDDGGWRGVGRDVTMLRERERDLQLLATLDPVTGLANRHQLHRRLGLHLSGDAPVDPCTLILIDLDNFKQVNDTLGHDAGDRLLREVGERLRESLTARRGAGDLIARLGGDEFALLLRGELEATSLQSLGKRLRSALAVPIMIDEHAIDVQASLGAATAPQHATQADELLRAADMALYAAKAAGRNRLSLFVPELREQVLDRAQLIAELREALEQHQFELHYQPQIELKTGRLRGFEALLRWRHPVRGLVPPAQFIPLAEDTGLIVPMSAWVMQRACRDATGWPDHLSVAVNVSAVEFERSPVRRQVRDSLAASGLAAHRLEVELTESALLHDSERAIGLLADLRALGVRVALDDFGTGFSSLAYLRRLPLDQIKVDRAFVADLDRPGGGGTALAIVAAIHELARALGLETIAEGIETASQLRALEGLGCGVGQGWLFAPALPADLAQRFIHDIQQEGLERACKRVAPLAEPVRVAPAPPVGRMLGATHGLPDTRWGAGV